MKKIFQIYSPVNGKCVDLKDVNDQMFAEKIMGDGIAFKYNENTIYSPFPYPDAPSTQGVEILLSFKLYGV